MRKMSQAEGLNLMSAVNRANLAALNKWDTRPSKDDKWHFPWAIVGVSSHALQSRVSSERRG